VNGGYTSQHVAIKLCLFLPDCTYIISILIVLFPVMQFQNHYI
jgi:hypothetical protein